MVLVHTDIDPAYEGQGLGSVLVKGALDDLRERGLRAVPLCPVRAQVPAPSSGGRVSDELAGS